MTDRRRLPRIGFTMIELLVVIAIIGVLLAITTGVILRTVQGRSQQSLTQQDIIGLSAALEKFKTDHRDYPPSSLNKNNVLTVLPRLFPGLNPPVGGTKTVADMVNAALAPLGLTKDTIDLQGDQCLVLFLAGRHIMSGGKMTEAPSGFSQNPASPFMSPTDSSEKVSSSSNTHVGERIAPYFIFDTSRFYQRSTSMPIASYGDGFFGTGYDGVAQNTCYAYFSTSFVPVPVTIAGSVGHGFYSETDCNRMTDALGGYPRPFVNLNATTLLSNRFDYVNPNSFQIISPGPDTLFGKAYKFPSSKTAAGDLGGISLPTSVPTPTGGTTVVIPAMDNFTNFYAGRLSES
ncbi:MAG TPA: type II secretion system protein [Gemmataceae bacterium]|jgi:prepilin-type N-terminal cleavage/methylation domain-containing protein|nr:type II secretion system protein [Gemmataceae bacterium]